MSKREDKRPSTDKRVQVFSVITSHESRHTSKEMNLMGYDMIFMLNSSVERTGKTNQMLNLRGPVPSRARAKAVRPAEVPEEGLIGDLPADQSSRRAS